MCINVAYLSRRYGTVNIVSKYVDCVRNLLIDSNKTCIAYYILYSSIKERRKYF